MSQRLADPGILPPDRPPAGPGRFRLAMPSRDPLTFLVLLALLVGAARRLAVGWDAPLWLDEIVTGAIAIQPRLDGLAHDLVHELGGPLYYVFIWLWEKAAGAGDTALRLPSLLFALATPLVILAFGPADRTTRWVWAGLVALWTPGAFHASEARSYALLFLLACVQLLLFRRLLQDPDRRRAAWWCGVSALLILTHPHALVLAGLQGLAYLAIWRERAVRTWPAALLFLPVAMWMTLHLPLLIRFTDPQVAWQRELAPVQMLWAFELAVGHLLAGIILFGIIVASSFAHISGVARGRRSWPYARADLIPALVSIAGFALIFALGFVRPTFSPRYLTPFIAGLLFGLAIWARAWGERWRPVPALLVVTMLILAAGEMRIKILENVDFRRGYSWEAASSYLRAEGVDHLIFLWENPTASIADPWLLGRSGAFYFHRAGEPVSFEVANAHGAEQSFRRALTTPADRQALRARTVGALMLGRRMNLTAFGPGWTCRSYGGPAYGADVYSTACVRTPRR